MLFSLGVLVPIAASAGVYVLFTGIDSGKHYWVAAAKTAAAVAACRIALVSVGAFLLENISGWLQLLAYFMVLCGLPEMSIVPRPSWGRSGPLLFLSGLMVVGTTAWIFALAAVAARSKRRQQ